MAMAAVSPCSGISLVNSNIRIKHFYGRNFFLQSKFLSLPGKTICSFLSHTRLQRFIPNRDGSKGVARVAREPWTEQRKVYHLQYDPTFWNFSELSLAYAKGRENGEEE